MSEENVCKQNYNQCVQCLKKKKCKRAAKGMSEGSNWLAQERLKVVTFELGFER